MSDGARRVEVAIHEAAHAIAATLLGGRIHAALLIDPPPSHGQLHGMTIFDELAPGSDAQVTYAGSWAAAALAAGRWPTSAQVFAILYPSAEAASADWRELSKLGGTAAGLAVASLLWSAWPAVVELAAELERTGTVRHKDVCRALKIPPTDNGVHLSMICSGAAPGSFTVTGVESFTTRPA